MLLDTILPFIGKQLLVGAAAAAGTAVIHGALHNEDPQKETVDQQRQRQASTMASYQNGRAVGPHAGRG